MTRESAAKKLGKIKWSGHQRPPGKKLSTKIIRQERKAQIRQERDE